MEQEPILSETLGRKLYSKRGVMIGTFLGGPLAGGYLLAKNFKTVNKSEKASLAWTIAIVAFFALMLLALIVPGQLPSFVFIFLYAWMGYFAAEKLQGDFLDKHEQEGGAFHSNWKAAGIGIIVTLILVALFIGIFASSVWVQNNN